MDPNLIFNIILGIMSTIPRNGNSTMNESMMPTSDYSTPNFSNDHQSDSSLLHDKVERLALINAAMWSLISEKLSISAEDLIAKIHEVDNLDGRLDGKISATAQKCPKCSRIMNSTTGNCLYCGYTPPPSDVSIQIASGNMRVGGTEAGTAASLEGNGNSTTK